MHEPQLVKTYYKEYLRFLNKYQNISRTGFFIKYFNIDTSISTYDEKVDSTFDLYGKSDIKFNIYDQTPVSLINPISNRTENVIDLEGYMFDANNSLTIFTINEPNIHDLITFYDPIKSDEIFRVTNITTPVNAVHSNPNVRWFQLDLEYAPLKSTKNLKINKHFVYDLSHEKYLTRNDFEKYINALSNISKTVNQIKDEFYITYLDLYGIYNSNNDSVFIPIECNEFLSEVKKKFDSGYQRLFETFYFPYGYKYDYFNIVEKNKIKIGKFPGNSKHQYNINFHYIDSKTKKILEYKWDILKINNNFGLIFLDSFDVNITTMKKISLLMSLCNKLFEKFEVIKWISRM
jgi:hypothetical protein